MNTVEKLLENANELRQKANQIIPKLVKDSSKIEYAYNPLEYAWNPHSEYIRRHGGMGAKTLLVGMNPGHGMGNTGIPFGCPKMVKEILEITGLTVGSPRKTHPKRQIIGLEHPKPEVSGTRIWGTLSQIYGPRNAAASEVFIVNHCPLWMFDENGRNITPDKLTGNVSTQLTKICNQHLQKVVEILEIKRVIGVGKYAQKRIYEIFEPNQELILDGIPHPSPANPFANRNGGEDWRNAFKDALNQS
ncbi:MAG: single-stranded DNA-binding protein [Euryarchaeota archaeon]|nr:single-stranded DNA-binding protein [Euryarchaeota archaeon]